MNKTTTDVFVVNAGNFTTAGNLTLTSGNTYLNAYPSSGTITANGIQTTNFPTYNDFWNFNEEFDLLWKSFFETNSVFKPIKEKVTNLACDIQETDNGLRIELAVVGLSKEDIDIMVDAETLRVAYRKEEQPNKNEDYRYLLRSIKKSSFDVAWKISSKYDLAKLEAKLEKGLLVLDIPFAKENKPKKITIK